MWSRRWPWNSPGPIGFTTWVTGVVRISQGMDCSHIRWVSHKIPGLVNIQKTDGKDPPFLMGKSTISNGPFSTANCKHLPEGKPSKRRIGMLSGNISGDVQYPPDWFVSKRGSRQNHSFSSIIISQDVYRQTIKLLLWLSSGYLSRTVFFLSQASKNRVMLNVCLFA